MNESFEIIVDHHCRGERLDVFLSHTFPHESRSYLQTLIKEGEVTLQGKTARCGEKIASGNLIVVHKKEKKMLAKAFPEDIALTVLYEDQDLIIIDKPAGMVVHVAKDHEQGTLVNALLHRWTQDKELSSGSASYRPGIVHRLDKETSGCIIVAKNDQTHASLSKSFSERTIKKTYLAIVSGKPRQRKGTIILSIGRHPIARMKMTERRPPAGREAITDYEVLSSSETESLLACFPHTGRMHQIRVHLQHLGHPIIGDHLYGKRTTESRHLLHAWKIEFIHPSTGLLIQCEAPLPKDFKNRPL